MFAASDMFGDDLVAACREVVPREGEGALTRLPGLLVARYRGDGSEAARDYFAALWQHIRPAVAGREAVTPRIWRT
jgi:urease accessory protein